MKQSSIGSNLLPWSRVGKPTIFVRSPDVIKKMILDSEDVKNVIA